jgi:hypothetical protein
MKRMNVWMIFGFAFMMSAMSFSSSLAASPKAQLDAYVAELQSSPDDQALREKIIRLAKKEKPKTPEGLTKLLGKGTYIIKHAQNPADFKDAVDAFKQASLLAPWKGSIYYNLGVAQEKAGDPQGAVNSFNLYLLAEPHAKDKEQVQERIGGLEYAGEKKAKAESFEGSWEVTSRQGNPEEDKDFLVIGRDSHGALTVNVKYIDQQPTFTVSGKNLVINVASDTETSKYDLTLSEDGTLLVGTRSWYETPEQAEALKIKMGGYVNKYPQGSQAMSFKRQ